jgi:lipopolysaccharide export system protein LptC
MASTLSADGTKSSQRAPRAMDAYLGLRRHHRDPILARFVGLLRVALPVIALGVVMIGLVWPLVWDNATGFRLNGARVKPDRGDYSTMDNPRFSGVDGHDRPYVITADRAVQIRRDDKVYDLTQPKGDIVQDDGRWVYVQANAGRYFQETRQLDLAGDVTLYHDKGSRLEGERARVDVVTGDVASDRPVEGYGPSGTVHAQGVHVSNNGRKLVFTGRSHMVIDNQPTSEAQSPASPAAPGGQGEGG